MGLLQRLFGEGEPPAYSALYNRIVDVARQPDWYRAGAVPDTIDGRFDMIALILSLVMLRLENAGADGRLATAGLAERFVDDMDGQMREIGFGDLVVGKQVGKVMSALGGRLGAYREGLSEAALIRNLWRGEAPAPAAVTWVRDRALALRAAIGTTPIDALLAGQMT